MKNLSVPLPVRYLSLTLLFITLPLLIAFSGAQITNARLSNSTRFSSPSTRGWSQNQRKIGKDEMAPIEGSTITNTLYLPLITTGSTGIHISLPYLQLVPASVSRGELTTAYGRNFCGTQNCSSITLTIDDRAISSTVAVTADGSFQASFKITELPGQYIVTATQTITDGAILKASAPLFVTRSGDEEEEEEGEEIVQSRQAYPTQPNLSANRVQFSATNAVTAFQPNILFGGRTVAVSISAANAAIAIAATESGGLFQTTDRGITWSHVDSLPPFRMKDVEIAPGNTQVIITTAAADSRTENGGGIWRSSDGGATWQKPATAVPPVATCGDRVSAYGIAFAPGTNDVFVGTDCGLAVSHDLGSTWNHIAPTLAGANLAVFDVTARSGINGSIIDVCAADGHHRSTDGGMNWTAAGAGLPRCFSGWVGSAVNSISTSPIEQDVLFAATLPISSTGCVQAFESDDGGANWTALGDLPACNRPPMIIAHRSRDGDANHIDVYYGNGASLFRQTCTNTGGPGLRCSGTSWDLVKIDHADQIGVAFNATDNCAQFVVSDGGIHHTNDCGATWTLTGGGNGGFQALQMYEMTGQVHPDHTDLYFGTQDNSIWASGDGGATWPNNICCEGFSFQIPHSTPADTGQTFIGVTCGACVNFRTDAHLTHYQNWNNPPGGGGDDPARAAYLIEPGVYAQFSINAPPTNTLFLSTDTGATWNAVSGADAALQFEGRPYVSGPPTNPTIYIVAIKPTTSGGFARGLLRITGVRSTSAAASWADNGLSSIDVYCNGDGTFVCPRVFGVDPNNPQHLVAADAGAGQMKVSTDGGASWRTDSQLTSLVTDNGRFHFAGQVHVIAFDPTNGNRILVGTEAAGVFISTDGGQTWGRLAGSEQVTAATSFFFDEVRNVVLASTYGRGMWRLDPQIPIANPGGPYSTQEGTDVVLDASGSSDPTGGALSYEWDFDNDGNFNDATGSTPTFDRVGQAGVFTVRLKVTSTTGFAIAATTVTVNNVAPSVNLSTNSPQNEGSLAVVRGVVSDPGWLNSLTALIDWGDGVAVEPIVGVVENLRPDATLTFSVTHVYADNGSYTVQMCGADNNGATTCSSSTLIVDNVPPTVDAGQNQIIYEGDTAVLDPSTFNDKGTLDTHVATIDWGDGSASDAVIVNESPFGPPGSINGASGTVAGQHQYTGAPGIYTVTVTVADKDGGVGSDTLTITVVPGFFRFCAYADEMKEDSSLSLIAKWATLDCAQVPGGAPGKTRAGGVGSRSNLEAEDHARIQGDMVSLQGEIVLKGDSMLAGNIAALDDVELEDYAQAEGNVTTAGSILLKNHSVVTGDANARGDIQLQEQSVISGAINAFTTVPLLAQITPVQFALSAGAQDVTVDKETHLALDPGSYRDVEIGTDATLTLRTGRYTFGQFETTRAAIVAFDLADGPIVIDVVNNVAFAEQTQMVITSATGDAADILFRVGGDQIYLSEEGVYLGTFLGLDSKAKLGQNATLTGALYGEQVEIRERTQIVGRPAVKVFAAMFSAPTP